MNIHPDKKDPPTEYLSCEIKWNQNLISYKKTGARGNFSYDMTLFHWMIKKV